MNFTPLTPAQKKSFEDDGFLLIPNALDAETLEQVTAACDRFAQPFDCQLSADFKAIDINTN